MSTKKPEVYVAFSGGGAKAITHIGALAHIEKTSNIVGVSGASAGAAVAAMKAAGFTAKDIFQPALTAGERGTSPLFDRIKKRNKDTEYLGDLIGGSGIKGLIRAKKNIASFVLSTSTVYEKIIFTLIFASIAYSSYFMHEALHQKIGSIPSAILSWIAFITLSTLFLGFIAIPRLIKNTSNKLLSGIATNGRAIDELCHEISVKMNIHNRDVLMRDFKMPLFIIATDVQNKCAKVFSQSTTPESRLSDALAASICIPLAFKPHKSDGGRYVDGGIVSNLPAFVFSEFRNIYPNRRVITLRLVEESKKNNEKKKLLNLNFFTIWKKELKGLTDLSNEIVETVFTGTQDLAHKGMRVAFANLPTPLGMLDFNLTTEAVADAYKYGEVAAQKISESFKTDDICTSACETISKMAKKTLLPLEIETRKGGEFVRVAMAFPPHHGAHILTLRYSHGFNTSTDSGMDIPIEATVCGEAWTKKTYALNLRSKDIRKAIDKFPSIRSRIDRDLQWILSVPIIDPATGASAFVINIDGNSKIFDHITRNSSERPRVTKALSEILSSAQLIGNATLEAIKETEGNKHNVQ